MVVLIGCFLFVGGQAGEKGSERSEDSQRARSGDHKEEMETVLRHSAEISSQRGE